MDPMKTQNELTPRAYLGDSVYGQHTLGGSIKLTTDNGHDDDPRNIIYLDQEVFDALVAYAARVWPTDAKDVPDE